MCVYCVGVSEQESESAWGDRAEEMRGENHLTVVMIIKGSRGRGGRGENHFNCLYDYQSSPWTLTLYTHYSCKRNPSACRYMLIMIIIIIIIIIQEISTAHNPEQKAGAQCAHRKTQNELPI